jgi:exodeoxyribonuclease VII large subunit
MQNSSLYAAQIGPDDYGAARLWRVGALLRAVADALQARLGRVRVQGEVSGCVRAASGHVYFSLKDEQGQLRCVVFRRVAQASDIAWRDGLSVELEGVLDIYGARGDLQLLVERARVAGEGSLYEQFLRRKAELEAQGCFDAARKRPLPAYPQSLGVVTSRDAAAWRDVLTTLHRRAPHVPVVLFPSLVQGEAAPAALVAALRAAYAHHRATGQCQVLLLVRGGGSLEDLWAFNHPQLVHALIEAPMPVVCGVGHETDVTLADFAADVRAPTPTAAAELCAPTREAQWQALRLLEQRLLQGAQRAVAQQAQRVDRLSLRLGRPSEAVQAERQRLLGLAHRLSHGVRQRWQREALRLERAPHDLSSALDRDLRARQRQLEQLQARWALLDPTLVLRRGYALLTDAHGHTVTSVQALQAGQAVRARLSDGEVDLTVKASGV